MKFVCDICGNELNLYKVSFVQKGSNLVCKKAVCCGEYMKQVKLKENEGLPQIKRNEEHMSGDKLWNDFKYNNTEK